MTDFVFANNINTALSAAITAGATTATVADASNLPSLAGGKTLVLTLLDAATKSNFEVVYCTAISGTTLTIARGQEGTTAQAYGSGDYVWGAPTAGILETFLQTADYATNAQSLAGTATNVVSNPAGVAVYVNQFGIGVDLASKYVFSTAADWHRESGFSCVVDTTSANLPASGYFYATCISVQDVGNDGSAWLLIGDLNNPSGFEMYVGMTANSSSFPVWRKMWSDGNFNPADYLTTANAASTYLPANSLSYVRGATVQTPSWSVNTTYTNSSGKPLIISLWGHETVGANPGSITIYVDGEVVAQNGSYGANTVVGVMALVPAGSTFEYTLNAVAIDGKRLTY